jgi:transcriptional regulator with XRE-family HTH domain
MESNVRIYRLASNLSQEDLAEALGIAHSTYLQKEKKRTSFTAREYLILQEKLGLTDNQLITIMNILTVFHLKPIMMLFQRKMMFSASTKYWEN